MFTDPTVAKLLPMKTVIHQFTLLSQLCLTELAQTLDALEAQTSLPFEVFDQVVAEPTEDSWRKAISWAREHDFSHFLA